MLADPVLRPLSLLSSPYGFHREDSRKDNLPAVMNKVLQLFVYRIPFYDSRLYAFNFFSRMNKPLPPTLLTLCISICRFHTCHCGIGVQEISATLGGQGVGKFSVSDRLLLSDQPRL